MYDEERLLIVPGHLCTLLSLAGRHVEMGRYGQERVLIVLDTSQYFLIPSLWTC